MNCIVNRFIFGRPVKFWFASQWLTMTRKPAKVASWAQNWPKIFVYVMAMLWSHFPPQMHHLIWQLSSKNGTIIHPWKNCPLQLKTLELQWDKTPVIISCKCSIIQLRSNVETDVLRKKTKAPPQTNHPKLNLSENKVASGIVCNPSDSLLWPDAGTATQSGMWRQKLNPLKLNTNTGAHVRLKASSQPHTQCTAAGHMWRVTCIL